MHEQAKMWNGSAGQVWVEEKDLLDAMLSPFIAPLMEVVPDRTDEHLLDVGCGTGATTIAAAARGGRCVGVDISAQMIARARERASEVGSGADFVLADAQEYAFEPGRFDRIISRFGVMFFPEPIKAFINLRASARAGARLRFIAWRGSTENPFMTTAERVAGPYLPDLPPRVPNAPGQFAFADRERIGAILAGAGWSAISVAPFDTTCSFPASQLPDYVMKMGPVGQQLQQAELQLREQVRPKLREAFHAYVRGDEVRFRAACWLVDASAG